MPGPPGGPWLCCEAVMPDGPLTLPRGGAEAVALAGCDPDMAVQVLESEPHLCGTAKVDE